MRICRFAIWFSWLLSVASAQFSVSVIEFTNVWRYEASGADLGTAWHGTNYDDSFWLAGPALLAFEDNPEVSPINTVLPVVGSTGAVLITHYFRTSFVYTNDLPAPMLVISNIVDDGAVFYLNGTEVARRNMPSGVVNNRTRANASSTEGLYNFITVPATNLWEGTNVFAVEVHQLSVFAGDVVFGMALLSQSGKPQVTVTPVDQVVPSGAPFLLTGAATGAAPFSYQWLHSEVPLANATNRRLLVFRSQLTNAGNYRLMVANTVGAETSSIVNVTITNPPSGPGAQNTAYQGEASGSLGTIGFVRAAVALTNGFLIGGQMPGFNGIDSPGIARLDSFGNVDPGFIGSSTVRPPQGNPTIYALSVAGNHIYVGGLFNGAERTNLARLNMDGSLDATFAPSIPPNGQVRLFVPQTNGGVIVAGEFTTVSGVSRGRLARLHANGSLDADYSQGAGANGIIRAALPLPGGKLLIGGVFTAFDGISQNGLARLNEDGSLDTTFLLAPMPPSGAFTFSLIAAIR